MCDLPGELSTRAREIPKLSRRIVDALRTEQDDRWRRKEENFTFGEVFRALEALSIRYLNGESAGLGARLLSMLDEEIQGYIDENPERDVAEIALALDALKLEIQGHYAVNFEKGARRSSSPETYYNEAVWTPHAVVGSGKGEEK